MGVGFTSVSLMAESLRLSVTFAFSHTFLLSWVTSYPSPGCRLTLGSQLYLQIQLYLLAPVSASRAGTE